jgi:hypothetical protein
MHRSISILSLLLLAGALVATGADGGRGLGGRPGYFSNASRYDQAKTEYWRAWINFKSSIEEVQKTLGATSPEVAQTLTQILTNVLFLEGKWDAWFTRHSLDNPRQAWPYDVAGDDYLRTLQVNIQLLKNLRKEKDPQKALLVLRDVALDMQVKADNCRNSGDGLGKTIKVKVRTTADGQEVGGFEVFYVQKGMYDVKSAHDRFPRQSSPTDEKILAPGGYALWVRKGAVTSEPITLRIGGSGEKQLSVDLEVPSP